MPPEPHARMEWWNTAVTARRHAGRLGIVVFVAVVLAGATGAWACVPQPLITITPVASGPAGAELTVNGYAVNDTAARSSAGRAKSCSG